MRLTTTLLGALVLLVSGLGAFAQNVNSAENNCRIIIPEVALVSVLSNNSESIVLQPAIPDEAGLVLDFSNARKSDAWINYSSILAGNGLQSRSLSAKINQTIPPGLLLKIRASGDAGQGAGKRGVPAGEIILSNTYQPVITGIGSGYTGAGLNKGHLLTYSLELGEPENYGDLLHQKDLTFTVIFTLIDDI